MVENGNESKTPESPRKLILINPLSPGDILIMTGTIRDLHLSYPRQYITDVRSPCPQIFENNPYITPLQDGEGEKIKMEYPLIHQAVQTGRHFSEGHREFLEKYLGVPIKKTSVRPDIFLSQPEMEWVSEIKIRFNYDGPYWIIVAGGKTDYTLKVYPYWQKVVDLLRGKIKFVQVGDKAHNHPLLNNVLDMRGQTDFRQLFRLSYHAQGAVCAVSLQMVIMQALRKPCVVIAGGREGMRWQAINDHRYIHTGGILNCCIDGGCWRSKIQDCLDVVDGVPRCMELITPEEIVRQIELYYEGGRLTYDR